MVENESIKDDYDGDKDEEEEKEEDEKEKQVLKGFHFCLYFQTNRPCLPKFGLLIFLIHEHHYFVYFLTYFQT